MPFSSFEQSQSRMRSHAPDREPSLSELMQICTAYNDAWIKERYTAIAYLPDEQREQAINDALEEVASVTMDLSDVIESAPDNETVPPEFASTIKRLDAFVEQLFVSRTRH